MVINEAKQEITLSFEELKNLVDKGLVADRFLLDVEFQLGHHINTGASNLKIVKTDAQGFEARAESPEELYDRTIRERDAIIASNEIYEELYWITNVEESEKRWCTPELFDYLELDQKQAIAEIKAASYPILVSFSESTYQSSDGNMWRVPYIVFSDKNTSDGLYLMEYPEKPMTRSYYMNNKREVNHVAGEIQEKYEASKFKSTKEWLEFAKKRASSIKQKKKNKVSIRAVHFYNIKRKDSVCVLNEHLYSENYIETGKFLTKNNPDWYKTWPKERKAYDNLSEEEKQLIVEKGRNAIDELSRCVMDLSNLRRTVDGQISKDYKREF